MKREEGISRPLPATKSRSRIMSAVRSRGNRSTELRLTTLLRRAGLNGWRRHKPILGKPDFVWVNRRVALFVDGCFWHGCPTCYQAPRHNRTYWRKKLLRNRRRDRLVTRELIESGWRVIRVWECELDAPDALLRTLRVWLGA